MPHKNLVTLLCEPHKQEQPKWVYLWTKPVAWNYLLFMLSSVAVGSRECCCRSFCCFSWSLIKTFAFASLKISCISSRCTLKKHRSGHVSLVSMWKKATDEIFYLRNWILCRCWRLIPAEIRQSSTFRHSVQPDAFINLSFVRVVELSISVLFTTPPDAVKPVSIYLKKSVRCSNSTVSLGQSFFSLLFIF